MSVLNWSGALSSGDARLAGAAGALVLDVRDLRMRYGRTDVLTGVTFTARRGEVLALLGPNGRARPRRLRSSRASGYVRLAT